MQLRAENLIERPWEKVTNMPQRTPNGSVIQATFSPQFDPGFAPPWAKNYVKLMI
jgi:hypothetical protein